MKKLIFSLIVLIVFNANAQNFEFGKVSKEELLENLKGNIKTYDEMQQSLDFIKGKIGYLFYDREEVTF